MFQNALSLTVSAYYSARFYHRVHCSISYLANKAPCFGQIQLLALRGSCMVAWASVLLLNAINHGLMTTTTTMPPTNKKSQTAKPSARPTPSTTAKPSKKRKMDANLQKYYAVRAGNKPGVYLTWAECQEQTAGFRGASCTYGTVFM